MTGWVVAACADTAHEPVNVTVSAATHDIHVHLATAQAFTAWREHLQIRKSTRITTHLLGEFAEATTVTKGWAVHVRLFGPAVEELR